MSAFNAMYNKVRDRNWGGTSNQLAAEPYISGYSFISWHLPTTLNSFLNANSIAGTVALGQEVTASARNSTDAGHFLDHSMLGVTPPGGTLNKAEFQALGGMKWSVPTNIDYGNSITVKYLEFSGLPILRIHRAWVQMIRDNGSGLTALDGAKGQYNKANYSATLLYWTTKPDGKTIEYYAAYTGVFPTKDPQDAFTGDIASIDKLEVDIDYNVDYIWHEPWVYSLIQNTYAMQAPYGAAGATAWSRAEGNGPGLKPGQSVAGAAEVYGK